MILLGSFRGIYDWSRFLAGSIAGLSVLALDDSNRRRTLALYLLARVAQVQLRVYIIYCPFQVLGIQVLMSVYLLLSVCI